MVWDAVSFFFSGLAVADFCSTFAGSELSLGGETGQFGGDLILAAGLSAMMSPVVNRAAAPGRLDLATVKDVVWRGCALMILVLSPLSLAGAIRRPPAVWVAVWVSAAILLLLAGRMLAAAGMRGAARRFGGERVAIIGWGREASWLARTLQRSKPAGVELVGAGRRAGSLDGTLADLLSLGRAGALDRVILAQAGLSNAQVHRIAHRLKALRIEVTSLFPLLGAGSLRPGSAIADIPLFVVTRRPQWGYGALSKLVMDWCFALLLLLWTAPLLLLIAAAIRLDSPGPILFRQRRHGLNGGEFEIFKFRTMVWEGRAAGSGAVQTGRRDRRVTRIGALLRQSSLDEVPQLLNVLNGTMSLVGPRPLPMRMLTEARTCDEITPEFAHRHRVKPGITGWAQVNGLRGATETAEQLRLRVAYDNFYIENWSPWFDLRILAMTPVSLLLQRDNAF